MPTRQRMPSEGKADFTYSLASAGVLAGSLADAALVYAIIANTGSNAAVRAVPVLPLSCAFPHSHVNAGCACASYCKRDIRSRGDQGCQQH